jgi:hypothetical protein
MIISKVIVNFSRIVLQKNGLIKVKIAGYGLKRCFKNNE